MSIGENFADLCNLAVAGYVAGTSSGQVKPTTAGVKAAVEAKIVVQEGTQFRLPDGSPLKPELPKPVLVAGQPCQMPKHRDAFAEGFTAARDSLDVTCDFTDPGKRAEWDAGYSAGADARLTSAG